MVYTIALRAHDPQPDSVNGHVCMHDMLAQCNTSSMDSHRASDRQKRLQKTHTHMSYDVQHTHKASRQARNRSYDCNTSAEPGYTDTQRHAALPGYTDTHRHAALTCVPQHRYDTAQGKTHTPGGGWEQTHNANCEGSRAPWPRMYTCSPANRHNRTVNRASRDADVSHRQGDLQARRYWQSS
jgi:hypothetical protein